MGIRLVLSKGNTHLPPISFDGLTQAGVDTTMSHEDGHVRPAPGDRVPYGLFTNKSRTGVEDFFGIRRTPAKERQPTLNVGIP